MPLHFFFFFCFGSGLPRSHAEASWTARRSKMRPPNPSSSLLHMGSGWHVWRLSSLPWLPLNLLPYKHSSPSPFSAHSISSWPLLLGGSDVYAGGMLTHWVAGTVPTPTPWTLLRTERRTLLRINWATAGYTLQKAFYWIQFPKAQTLETILQGPWIFLQGCFWLH